MFTKLEWLVNHILSVSQSVHKTCKMFIKLEWLVNHILLFSQSVHAMYVMFTDYHPVWGLLRLALIIFTVPGF